LRGLARFLLLVLLASAGVLLFFGTTGGASWQPRAVLVNLGAAALFSVLIAGPLQLILPRVGPALSARFGAPLNWVFMIAIMMATALAGSAVAIVALIELGLVPAGAFLSFFAGAARISLAITLTFGIGISTYERMRKRADAADLALRVKERDEAEARRAAAEARLASLESRVQPHFLFNTLNSIAALIPEAPSDAERMTARLATLLRASLDSADTPLLPLAREAAIVRTYLEIERVRFGDRLRFTIDIPADIETVTVPRFALQTLVENSVKFAVAPRRDGGSIHITATASDASLVLTVDDDGPGFALEAAPPHHGLALLRERLALSYDAGASLSVQRLDGRTRVLLTLPR
jgi:hypothetical protein